MSGEKESFVSSSFDDVLTIINKKFPGTPAITLDHDEDVMEWGVWGECMDDTDSIATVANELGNVIAIIDEMEFEDGAQMVADAIEEHCFTLLEVLAAELESRGVTIIDSSQIN